MRKSPILCSVMLLICTMIYGCGLFATPPVTGEDVKSATMAEMTKTSFESTAVQTTVAVTLTATTVAEADTTATAVEPLTTVTVSEPVSEPVTEPDPEPVMTSVRLVSVGDNLIHNTVINAGKKADGSYNFDMLFEGMGNYFAEADLACINQETAFIDDPAKYDGYPRFASPTMVGDAIRKAGFDIVLHASNHSMDRGNEAGTDTIEYWEQYPEILMLGMYGSEEAASKPAIIEKNGISIAFFNYTYWLNGYKTPEGKPWMVAQMTEENEPAIRADLEEARAIADVVIVYAHWGSEYVYKPDSFQLQWEKIFADCGVDIVIGHHPHVLQPMNIVDRADGGKMLVYYSLGNYCSHQDQIPRMLGGAADIIICKQGEDIWVQSAQLIPLATQIENGYFTTYFLEDYTDELAKAHKFNGKFGFEKYNPGVLWDLYKKVTGFTEEDMEFLDESLYIGRQ